MRDFLPYLLIAFGAVAVSLGLLVTVGLCRAAARGDRQDDELRARLTAERAARHDLRLGSSDVTPAPSACPVQIDQE